MSSGSPRPSTGGFSLRSSSLPCRGGVYAVIDGQHRTTAAAACGIESVPCQIIQADAQEQARAFAAINGVKRNVTNDQKYRAALAAGDPAALNIRRVTEAAGIRLLPYNPSTETIKPGETTAHTAVRHMIGTFADRAIFVMRCLRAAAADMPGSLKGQVFYAATQVFEDHPEWFDRPDVVAAFEEVDLVDALDQAISRSALIKGLATRDLLAATMIDAVQARIKSRQMLLPAPSRKAPV